MKLRRRQVERERARAQNVQDSRNNNKWGRGVGCAFIFAAAKNNLN